METQALLPVSSRATMASLAFKCSLSVEDSFTFKLHPGHMFALSRLNSMLVLRR